MTTISLFYGIIIRMYIDPNGKYKAPHIHAEYRGNEAVFNTDGDMLDGDMSRKQWKMIVDWIAMREEDLTANWQLLLEGQQLFRIAPLQ